MKQSLFKQKIKQAKANQKENEKSQSFPYALKINLKVEQNQAQNGQKQQQDQPKVKNNINQNQSKNNILQNCQSFVSKEQLQKIRQQNNKLIKNMSQKQILKLRKMILQQMPKSFTGKLLKKIGQSKQQQLETKLQKQNILNKQQNYVLHQNQKNQISQSNQKFQTKQEEKLNDQQVKQEFLESLFIDITTGDIITQNPQNILSQSVKLLQNLKLQNFIKINQLKTMIGSENNQTQIIGCQIFQKTIQKLNKYGKIIKTGGSLLHRSVLIDSLYQKIIPLLLVKLQNIKFKTVWVQIVLSLCQLLDSSFIYEINQELFLKIIKKCQNTVLVKKFQQVQAIQQKVSNTLKRLKQNNFIIKNQFNFQNQLNNIDENIELIILQESQFQLGILNEEKTFITKLGRNFKTRVNEFQQQQKELPQNKKIAINNQKSSMISLIFNLVWRLKINLNTPVLTKLKDQIFNYFKQFCLKFISKQILNIKSKQFQFQICSAKIKSLYIIKQIEPSLFEQFVNHFNDKKIIIKMKSQQDQMLLLGLLMGLSLQKYRQSELKGQQQINNIVMMIQSLQKILDFQNQSSIQNVQLQFSSQIFFNQILYLYQNDNSVYNQAKVVKILDKLIKNLLKNITKTNLGLIVPIQRLKVLIQKYNFSSFGNNSFTKLIFVLSTISLQYQRLILQEVMSRYPFLFYYGCQSQQQKSNNQMQKQKKQQQFQVYILKDTENIETLYLNKQRQKQEQLKQIRKQLSQMIEKDPQFNRNNIYYKYLTK